ncbi:MAG: sigma-70 family RNA polymerase sigma factor [Planctomycetes bacterium]|nr:sigma-70 family RNA polymerase sigma factor [Planctomycetota bacterium]
MGWLRWPKRPTGGFTLVELTGWALSRLDERHRTMLVLRFYHDMRYAEIARLLDCTQTTARAAFFRAKQAFRRQLA